MSSPFFLGTATSGKTSGKIAFMNPNISYRILFRWFPVLLLISVLLFIYSNSLNADWQMDDRPNIIDNPGLRIHDLMPESLWGTFFANQGKTPKLYRPLPCLTFALNWYAGRDDPFGYHMVNLGCHMITAVVLYFLIMHLLMLLRDTGKMDLIRIQNIALLAAILWAVNPIQTQAVTYIVQRMAIMVTLFYILGMLFFIKARTAKTIHLRWLFGFVCFLCFLCGLGSKENAVLLPASLVLVEWIFFHHGRTPFFFQHRTILAITLITLVLLFIIHLTYGLPFHYILSGYDQRPFTLTERMMTEPRIILGYITQIFLPLPGRLSIAHDVTVYRSLLDPWTTLPAIMIITGSIGCAFAGAHRYPLASFAVLFYFLNHIVESTVLPIELVFEHRNYLPSLFLFLPIATGLYNMMMRLRQHSVFLFTTFAGIIVLIITGLGLGTYTRNKAWATTQSLWQDAAIKAPGSIRPLVNLGIQLAWRDHPTPADYRHALVLFKRSISLSPNRMKEQAEILGNMAAVYFHQGNNEKAIETYHQALEIDPDFIKNRFDLIKPLVIIGKFKEAEIHARQLVSMRPDNLDYLNLMGFILMWENKPDKALEYFRRAMAKGLHTSVLMLNIGVAMTRLHRWQNGRWFLQIASFLAPDDLYPRFALIENRIRAGDQRLAEQYAKEIIVKWPVTAIAARFKDLAQNFCSAPLSLELIAPVIRIALQNSQKLLLDQIDQQIP